MNTRSHEFNVAPATFRLVDVEEVWNKARACGRPMRHVLEQEGRRRRSRSDSPLGFTSLGDPANLSDHAGFCGQVNATDTQLVLPKNHSD